MVAPHWPASVVVAWLRIDPTSAARRARPGDHRPQPEDLAVQAARRDPLFAAVADVVLDAGRSVDGNVAIVLDRLTDRPRLAERARPMRARQRRSSGSRRAAGEHRRERLERLAPGGARVGVNASPRPTASVSSRAVPTVAYWLGCTPYRA